jgi:hypothetical protein
LTVTAMQSAPGPGLSLNTGVSVQFGQIRYPPGSIDIFLAE